MAEIRGTPGNDHLVATGTGDTMIGLAGDDVYVVLNPDDLVVEESGEGADTVYAHVDYRLRAGTHVETLSAVDWSASAALNLTGNGFVNTVQGNAGVNLLDGGAGADVLVGFGGNDKYVVDNSADLVVEGAGGGTDSVSTLVDYQLAPGSQVERLNSISFALTSPLKLTGNEFVNLLEGNAGNNTLDGRGGADTMVGFGGNDKYVVDTAGDVVVEGSGGGTDSISALVDYTLALNSHVERLNAISAALTTPLKLTGNNFVNQIEGNAGNNTLDGRGGGDALIGFGGDDKYVVDNAGDVVVETAGGGNDSISAIVDYTLAPDSHVERLNAISFALTSPLKLTGNNFVNLIEGNAGNNTLDGRGGADTMVGFGGDDKYVVDNAGDVVTEGAGGGNDRVSTLVDYQLAAGSHVERLNAISFALTTPLKLTGNEFVNLIEANAGNNQLDGKGGADTLVGFGGADTFAFTTALGAGNVDTITDFTPGVDKIILAGGQGDPFASLATGALGTGSFLSGSSDPYAGAALPPPGSLPGMDSNDYILYHTPSGALFYDADGNGAGPGVRFATLQPGLSLTAADFIVSGPANNAPAITSGGAVSVPESSPVGAIVYQTAAGDADGDRITYSLSGTDAALLTIDPVTGAVRLNSAPDFETKASYVFNVVASDSGTSTARAVALTITDVAEATPIINEIGTPNDSTAAAQFIDRTTFVVAGNPNLPDPSLPSATIVGNLPDAADEDFFSIILQAGEKLILDVDNSGGDLDSHVHVFNSAGVQIGGNDDPSSYDPGSDINPTYDHNVDSLFSFRAPAAGTYYFSIEPFQDPAHPTFGSYQINVSIGPPASQAQIIEEDIEALIDGAEWPTTNITYSFPNSGADYSDPFGDNEPATFQAFSGIQAGAAQQMLLHISNVSMLTFQQLFDPDDGAAQLRYAMTDATEAAHAYLPGHSDEAGSAWFNKEDFLTPQRGSYDWMGILHETGHAIGLKHGHEAPAISPDRDSLEYTVMTYRSFPGQDVSGDGGYTNETWGYPQSLMMYDIAALQRIYGANFTSNSGNTVYSWSPVTGEMSINGVGQGGSGENRVFMTIWDGGGTDTYDLSNYAVPTFIDLRPGEWSQTSLSQIANLGSGHMARGNVANALLHESDVRSLIENAIGGSAADAITANQARNQLTGNGGVDNFVWSSAADAGVGANADSILDFLAGTDKIGLALIDAVPATPVDDAFTFIGTSAFHNVAGELRYQVEGPHLRIQGDLDGNGIADLEIIVNNNASLDALHFFL